MTDTQIRPTPRKSLTPPQPHVALLGIGTANPPSITQLQAVTLAEEFACESDGQRAWLRRVFLRSGVEHRATVLQTPNADNVDSVRNFYGPPSTANGGGRGPTTATRMQRYALEAPPLMERAARAALADAQTIPDQITHIITVSCTGFFAPGLDVELISRLKLAPNVRRLHIGFMGCHAAFNALAAARDMVRAEPNARVLVCCVELSTLHFAYGWNPEKLVANALFADGAASCVLGISEMTEPGATGLCTHRTVPHTLDETRNPKLETRNFVLLDSASLLLPDSRHAMTWTIGDHGYEMTLSAELPTLIASHIRPWVERWLSAPNLAIEEIQHWAIHPGGPKILNAVRDALGLPDQAMKASTEILREHGNMSSTTVLFVLQRLLKQAETPGPAVAIGFGPGLMAEGMLLELGS